MRFLSFACVISLFFFFSVSQAQNDKKIQTFQIYSGQRCVYVQDSSDYFTTCVDTVCYGASPNPSQQLTHIVELVMFDNHEFWYVENSPYSHHKDSLLFFTGTWKADSSLFRLNFDSISKPLRHFKRIEYRPKYFAKPIVRNYCVYYAPNKVEPLSYYWTAYYGDMHSYSNQRNIVTNLCTASVPRYLEFPIQTKKMHKFYTYKSDKLCVTMPFVEIQLTYSQPVKIRQKK